MFLLFPAGRYNAYLQCSLLHPLPSVFSHNEQPQHASLSVVRNAPASCKASLVHVPQVLPYLKGSTTNTGSFKQKQRCIN